MKVIKHGIALDFTKEVTCPRCQAVLEVTNRDMLYSKTFHRAEEDMIDSDSWIITCTVQCPDCRTTIAIFLSEQEQAIMENNSRYNRSR